MSRLLTMARIGVDKLLGYFGYVRAARLHKQVAELRDAEHDLHQRFAAGHTRCTCANASVEFRQATDRLDNCVQTLSALMQNEWPETIVHDPAEAREAASVGAA